MSLVTLVSILQDTGSVFYFCAYKRSIAMLWRLISPTSAVCEDIRVPHVPFACFFETIFAYQLRTGNKTQSRLPS